MFLPGLAYFVQASNSESGTAPDKDVRLWSDTEFERAKEVTKEMISSVRLPLLQQEVTVYIPPPFYKGELPLIYSVLVWGTQGDVTILMDLGEWSNEFVYLDLDKKSYALANGARATARASARVMAEAKLLQAFAGSSEPVLIEEYHYGEDGKVIFKCRSYFNKHSGFKESETETWGKKVKDYFLIWPMGS